MEQVGICRFCKQTQILQHKEEMTQQQADECATNHCECDEAKDYQQTANRRHIAKQRIDELFGSDAGSVEQPEGVLTMLHNSVDLVCDKKLKQIVVTVKTGLRCRIMQMAKDKIKVVLEMSEIDNFEQ